ncbi:hypothetical protein Y032_0217g2413 [Ancylostoma ceylanicum]|nr:hypothetical protein Y032_0217g2413 [Ancylostoma ceylanicum]
MLTSSLFIVRKLSQAFFNAQHGDQVGGRTPSFATAANDVTLQKTWRRPWKTSTDIDPWRAVCFADSALTQHAHTSIRISLKLGAESLTASGISVGTARLFA